MLKNIAVSLLFGLVAGAVNWLLQFMAWFHQESYSWWRPIAFSVTMALLWLFVIIPISNKEKTRRAEAKQTQNK